MPDVATVIVGLVAGVGAVGAVGVATEGVVELHAASRPETPRTALKWMIL
ncbi:hypothetical protein OAA76_04225 [Planktotalea frisia]|nr:hypothetical protein [Planktotalea frisia]